MKHFTRQFSIRRFVIVLAATIALAGLIGGGVLAAGAYANSVTFSGQGLIADGFGGYDLRTEICGVANGADVNGPYLLWVLTAPARTTQTSLVHGERPQ